MFLLNSNKHLLHRFNHEMHNMLIYALVYPPGYRVKIITFFYNLMSRQKTLSSNFLVIPFRADTSTLAQSNLQWYVAEHITDSKQPTIFIRHKNIGKGLHSCMLHICSNCFSSQARRETWGAKSSNFTMNRFVVLFSCSYIMCTYSKKD